MIMLSTKVAIDRRFARSARLDADLNGTPPLVGYVLQGTAAKALTVLAESQIESQQGAFTWTGPYGGGKSSAALLLANLVAGHRQNKKVAKEIAGSALSDLYAKAFPKHGGEWQVVAVTGGRVRLRDAIAEASARTFGWNTEQLASAGVTDVALIDALLPNEPQPLGGTLVILDELGKMLEHEALEGGDVLLLQDLAERASRSNGRLVVIGILHQSFEQYAARAARDARQEWAKVQGRYQDIAFLSGADETVALLGRAIASDPPPSALEHARTVAEAVSKRRPTETGALVAALADTWPLNPVTALLLGPVSRSRFAQNERSVFGFLSSAEPSGFQQFLAGTGVEEGTYDPSVLWDYLASNFGMTLASGPDGSRFSLAFEAIERAGAKGGALHVALTKSAAVIEFFRNGSGVALADDFIAAALPTAGKLELAAAIKDLLDWAILIRQPRLGGYALFAGSDFDLDDAVGRAITPIDNRQLESIPHRAGFGFATAKRHYFVTGTLRNFEVVLLVAGTGDTAKALSETMLSRKEHGSGVLALMLGDGSLASHELDDLARNTANLLNGKNRAIAVGAAADSLALRSIASELLAVERVIRDHPQLEGDRIARREVAARHSLCVDELHRSLEAALETAHWFLAPAPEQSWRAPLTVVASALADAAYPLAPILKSELLQRDKPSSNANAALRDLAYAMVNRCAEENLGITGYPAELGLYLTVLKPFGLHRVTSTGEFAFGDPDLSEAGRSLQAAWGVLDDVGANGLDAVFSRWALPPYGIKAGVMPLIALAYMMSRRESVAVYIDGVYQTAINDVVVDKLLQKPSEFRLRRVDRSVRETAFLSGLGERLGVAWSEGSLPVAAALFQRFESLPAYSKRTHNIDAAALKIRAIVTKASDPEALLFDDLPQAFGKLLTAELIYDGLLACEASYPGLLEELRQALAKALGVDAGNFEGISDRVVAIKGLTSDYGFEALGDRAVAIEQGTGDLESLVSVLLHRPAKGWSDRDREQALTEIARFGRRFRELEALAVVRDRQSHTEALALVVGLDPKTPPVMRSFVLSDIEKSAAASLAERVVADLRADNKSGRLRLAALARAVAMLAAEGDDEVDAT